MAGERICPDRSLGSLFDKGCGAAGYFFKKILICVVFLLLFGQVFTDVVYAAESREIYAEEYVSDEDVKNLENSLDKVPEEILSEFFGKGFCIKITNDLIPYGEGDAFRVLGLLHHMDRTIYIYKGYPEGIIHEMGHFFDFYIGMNTGDEFVQRFSTSEEWVGLCGEQERSILAGLDQQSRDNTYNYEECFAEAFSHYLNHDAAFMESLPEMYDFLYRQVVGFCNRQYYLEELLCDGECE